MAMNRRVAWIGGASLGAGVMYLLDPLAGRRRRARIRDQIVHWIRSTERAIDATRRDIVNRACGLGLGTRSRLRRRVAYTQEGLRQQVREHLARTASHPRSIAASVEDGVVTLSGSILRHEVDAVIEAVSAVPGVRRVDNRMKTHEHGADVPGQQGAPARRMGRGRVLPGAWPPAMRVAAGAAGAALAVSGARRRTLPGIAAAVAGLGLLARSATNMPMRRLIGLGAGRKAVDLQQAIHIDAPVDRVFDLWSRYENFPRFMSYVREVRQLGPDWSHWVVAGPAGVPVEWDAEITEFIPRTVLAWKTTPGSIIQHSGVVRFDDEDGGTRVTIRMSYNPATGAIGHVIADLLGADPKTRMDQDLAMMKTFVETGRAPRPPRPPAPPGRRRAPPRPTCEKPFSTKGDRSMSIMRWDPVDDLGTLRRQMDRMPDEIFARRPTREGAPRGWAPAIDVLEADNEVVVRAELPNLDPERVEISVSHDTVTLRGESRREEERQGPNYYRRELRYGAFSRTVPLPTEVKSAADRATYKDGLLEVRIPKSEQAQATSVKVQAQQ
jgi:uncharacterized membrane protein/HSP20 family molecular chaperone IbpA